MSLNAPTVVVVKRGVTALPTVAPRRVPIQANSRLVTPCAPTNRCCENRGPDVPHWTPTLVPVAVPTDDIIIMASRSPVAGENVWLKAAPFAGVPPIENPWLAPCAARAGTAADPET